MAATSRTKRDIAQQGRPVAQIWPDVTEFQHAQDLLDRNRLLIAEIAQNHEQGTHSAVERNVPLLQELNENIARVIDLYKHAADSFVASFDPSRGEEGRSGTQGGSGAQGGSGTQR